MGVFAVIFLGDGELLFLEEELFEVFAKGDGRGVDIWLVFLVGLFAGLWVFEIE
jgi:hypothetical protein